MNRAVNVKMQLCWLWNFEKTRIQLKSDLLWQFILKNWCNYSKNYVKAILLLNMFVMSQNNYLNNLRMFTTKFFCPIYFKKTQIWQWIKLCNVTKFNLNAFKSPSFFIFNLPSSGLPSKGTVCVASSSSSDLRKNGAASPNSFMSKRDMVAARRPPQSPRVRDEQSDSFGNETELCVRVQWQVLLHFSMTDVDKTKGWARVSCVKSENPLQPTEVKNEEM